MARKQPTAADDAAPSDAGSESTIAEATKPPAAANETESRPETNAGAPQVTEFICAQKWQYGQAASECIEAGTVVGAIMVAPDFPGNASTLADGIRNGRFSKKPIDESPSS